ncbi:hypothetical protein EUTSA_v10017313mg [Eutrema salsugineum]|uniref:Uncharacterized protein n=1 Tax=Eutrema salsugineum TaxID=72664 RepID=V4LLN1_EUTSA|nr:hypothetical protein EUTSA_v10017313mg [Eutrema salsugineum]
MLLKKRERNLTGDLNRFDISFLRLRFRHSHSQNSILHRSFHLIHLHILRQPKPPRKLPTRSLHTVPRVVLILLLHVSLSTDLQNAVFLDLHLHFLLLKSRQVRLEHVRLRRLPPVHTCVHDRSVFSRKRGRHRRKLLEWIPDIHRERIEDAATPVVAEEAWNHRHFSEFLIRFRC